MNSSEIIQSTTSFVNNITDPARHFFAHLNIQSLKPKLVILEVEPLEFTIQFFTETWLHDADVSNHNINIKNFQTTSVSVEKTNRVGEW